MAQIICMELTLHSMVEERDFLPAFAHATGDEQHVERALKAHQHVKELIARLSTADNLDGAVDAIWRHALEHIEEERRDIGQKNALRTDAVHRAIYRAPRLARPLFHTAAGHAMACG